MLTRRSTTALVSVLSVFVLAGNSAAGQVTGDTGKELFNSYCAACHGVDAKGNGPAAATFKIHPANLTTIAKNNGGTFPTDRITSFVFGPDNLFIAAHGSSAMPVWGPIFRALDPSGDNRARFAKIVAYLESIQSK